jgi:hypothetical protein
MNRRTGDLLVGAIAVVLAFGGGILTGQAYERQQSVNSMMGSMMDGSTGTMNGPGPITYVVGTLVVVGVVAGVYLAIRESRTTVTHSTEGRRSTSGFDVPNRTETAPASDGTISPDGQTTDGRTGANDAGSSGSEEDRDSTAVEQSAPPADDTQSFGDGSQATDRSPETGTAGGASDRVIEVLPEDERRILEPILDSPGITQIALRDRSEFSKSKVSQTVTDLEKRGLLYREKQGRTYRVYPADDIANGDETADA